MVSRLLKEAARQESVRDVSQLVRMGSLRTLVENVNTGFVGFGAEGVTLRLPNYIEPLASGKLMVSLEYDVPQTVS